MLVSTNSLFFIYIIYLNYNKRNCLVYFFLAGLIPTVAFAVDGELSTETGKVIIPFEKIWVDESESTRPESITVNLYKYVGTLDAAATPIRTATVTHAAGWKYEFDISNETLFDANNNAYLFAIKEEPVAGYKETAHTDPIVTFIPPSVVDDAWNKISPCNELDINNSSTSKSVVIAKKGNDCTVWTVDPLSASERKLVFDSAVASVDGMAGLKMENATFISGLNGSYAGLTVTSDKILFDAPSDWAFFATGLYNKSATEANGCSITNTRDTYGRADYNNKCNSKKNRFHIDQGVK